MAKKNRLSQIIAVEKQVKSRARSDGAELQRNNQRPDLFNGMNRSYEKKDEEGEDLPGEQKLVQQRTGENLKRWSGLWTEVLDVVATKDWGNTVAKCDLEVDGETIAEDVPVTYLIWLEKQLDEMRNYVATIPVLDPSKSWQYEDNSGLYVTEPVKTARHKKVPRVLLKVEATEHHPAQADVVHDDILVGYWSNVSSSGAMPDAKRREMLERIDTLKKAVKEAREEANSLKVDDVKVGSKLMNWLMK